MKPLSCSALVLAVTMAPGLASDRDGSTLDQELEALASSLLNEGGGPGLFGRVTSATFASSDRGVDLDGDGLPDRDLGGLGVSAARLGLRGYHGGYSYRVEMDFADDWGEGTLGLLDAFATFPVCDRVTATVGRFRAAVSANARLDSGRLVFPTRSTIGSAFSARDEGLMLSGHLSSLGWELSAMGGLDGQSDEILSALRVNAHLMGSGANKVEGAFGGPGETRATAAVAVVEDGAVPDSRCTLLELRAASDTWSLSFEFVDVGSGGFGSLAENLLGVLSPDTNPHSLGTTFMVAQNWELGLRVQVFDLGDLRQTDLVANHYIAGHDLKWAVGITQLRGDDAGIDLSTLGFGLNVAF